MGQSSRISSADGRNPLHYAKWTDMRPECLCRGEDAEMPDSTYPKFCPVAMAASLLDLRWTMLLLCEIWSGSRICLTGDGLMARTLTRWLVRSSYADVSGGVSPRARGRWYSIIDTMAFAAPARKLALSTRTRRSEPDRSSPLPQRCERDPRLTPADRSSSAQTWGSMAKFAADRQSRFATVIRLSGRCRESAHRARKMPMEGAAA